MPPIILLGLLLAVYTHLAACQTATTTIIRTSASTIIIVGTEPTGPSYTITPSTKTTDKPTTPKPTGPSPTKTETVTTTIYTYTTIYVTSTPKTTSKTTTKTPIVVTTPPPTGTQNPDPNLAKCPVPLYYKCGGNTINWNGCTKCVAGAVCTSQNEYYSQCVAPDGKVAAATARPRKRSLGRGGK